jgi:hypothetical protein
MIPFIAHGFSEWYTNIGFNQNVPEELPPNNKVKQSLAALNPGAESSSRE